MKEMLVTSISQTMIEVRLVKSWGMTRSPLASTVSGQGVQLATQHCWIGYLRGGNLRMPRMVASRSQFRTIWPCPEG